MPERYRAVVSPRMDFEDERLMQTTCTVHEPESNSRKTGLIDVRGNAIHAVGPREPAGYFPLRER